MEALRQVTGIAAPLLRANVDTDQIIPTRFLTRTSEEGLHEGLFAEWATRADGTPDPGFVLNQPAFKEARILLGGPNFGCGSSREGAPRALRQRGFRSVIAPSFGDIFYNNCFRSGIVPVRLPQETVEALARQGGELTVSVDHCAVRVEATGEMHAFLLPKLLRRMLQEGLDEVALTLTQQAAMDAFRVRDRALRPWAYL
ncbi:3-isopropylmalate dehydratase small subunit [Ramlibacter sp. G-1-2-2]|uniref:3-isopropylmalate dehydratase small subunit n=1 Tax=Ramlibacter agri TaxID=2728837 RepID=A0A848H8F6_9BURK|nr:3-isopropylmalate dehydratase small subunit [Ramlibacter agri]NML43948.1 3-isopropylmalate dehydratase small subunit [Ramlibacter agri]